MHDACQDFVRRVRAASPEHFTGKKVLEVGAFNVNGSARDRFKGCEFVGVDVRPGPGVDHVCDGAEMPFDHDSFDVVFSTETFEHAENWRAILKAMQRAVKPGGLLFVTAATAGRPPHGSDGGEVMPGEFYCAIKQEVLRASIRGMILLWEEDYRLGDLRAAWIR